MTHSFHFWLRLFLLFLGLCNFGLLVVTVLRPKDESGKRNWRWPGSLARFTSAITFGGKAHPTHDLAVFLLGFVTCWVLIQFQHRDTLAAFHARPQVHWKIVREYPSRSLIGFPAFDIDQNGDITHNVTPCEKRGLHPGAVITSVGFRDMGECLSFAEPGWMKIEYPEAAER